MQHSESNKTNVASFYETMCNACHPRRAVALYMGSEYIQRNLGAATGKDAFFEYLERMAEEPLIKEVKALKVIS